MKTPPTRFIALPAFCLAALLAASAPWASDMDGLSEGQAAFNAGNYALAVAKWSELAATGHSDAQVFIGLSYANGWGVEKNPELASVWYQKAANSENPSGQFLLGLHFIKGSITGSSNPETATGLMWLRRAAANGDDSAQRFLERARERNWFKGLLAPQDAQHLPTDNASPGEQHVAVIEPPVADSDKF